MFNNYIIASLALMTICWLLNSNVAASLTMHSSRIKSSWILGSFVAFLKGAKGAPIPPSTEVVQSLNIQQKLYQALALGALSLLAILHRSLVSTGFSIGTLRGTDETAGVSICVGTVIWYAAIIITGWTSDGQPCRQSWDICLARLSYAPNILLLASFLWIRSPWEVRLHNLERKPALWFQIWQADPEKGQFAWDRALTMRSKFAVALSAIVMTGLFSFGSFRSEEYLVAVLNVVGATLFISQTVGQNSYNKAPQRYNGLVRVAIGTDQVAGTTYVFSGAAGGISAVYGPCIDDEHQLVNEKTLPWLRNLRTEWSNPVDAGQILRSIAIDIGRRTILSDPQLNVLAEWFYTNRAAGGCKPTAVVSTVVPADSGVSAAALAAKRSIWRSIWQSISAAIHTSEKVPAISPLVNGIALADSTSTANNVLIIHDFQVAKGSSAIGRESVYALYQLEFLLFSRRKQLKPEIRSLIGQWRNLDNTGAEGLDHTQRLIGQAGGLIGLKEVLRRVGHLLGVVGEEAESIPRRGQLPDSSVLGRHYETHDQYAAALWDRCCVGSESVLLSLYLFLALWNTELGANAGYHPIPLRKKEGSSSSYLVTWGVLWRQGWYIAVLAQVTGLLSAVLGAFIAGVLR
jgi:hypothetical protein